MKNRLKNLAKVFYSSSLCSWKAKIHLGQQNSKLVRIWCQWIFFHEVPALLSNLRNARA